MASRQYSPATELLAGSLAGVADACASHPIDQVKTQFHVNKATNGTVLEALRSQYARGGVPQLYRGLFAACLRPQALCMYAGNEASKRVVAGPGGELDIFTASLAGGLTGYVESLFVTPFEVVKVRMQSLDHVGKYHGSIHCARTMVAEEGKLSLFNGLGASCGRNCVFNAVYFGFIFAAKQRMPKLEGAAEVAANMGTGMAASFAATVVKMPFDVAKSRIQNQLPGSAREYSSTMQAMSQIARTEGMAALWKGFSPTASRIVLGFGVSNAVFEATLDLLL